MLIQDANLGCMLHDYHMAVSANGLCTLLINVGSEPFAFTAANRDNASYTNTLDPPARRLSYRDATLKGAPPSPTTKSLTVFIEKHDEKDPDEMTPSPSSPWEPLTPS